MDVEDQNSASNSRGINSTAADNIRSLTEIEKDIPKLLQSAGSAVSLLTNSPVSQSLSAEDKATQRAGDVEARKSAFLNHVRTYFTTLRSVNDALEAQSTALEEAGIIPPEAPRSDEPGITNGGLGNMGDVAWLNQRSRDVGLDKEKELRSEAEKLIAEAKEVRDTVMGNGT